MTIYLYVKTHNQTGLKYLGKTIKSDPHKYTGSGTRWLNHLSVHGYDYSTEILKECQTEEEIKEWGLYYSKLWNVVESDQWANLMEETGDGRSGPHKEETKIKIGLALKDKPGRKLSQKERDNLSKINTGKIHSEETKNKLRKVNLGKLHSEETKQKMRDKIPWNFGVSHSKETKEKISKAGIGRNHSEETKEKMSISQKARIWITNGEISKSINEKDNIPEGWIRGRNIKWSTKKS